MPKIVAIIPVYNSADVILEALKSIDGKVDEILCFDGRWEGYVGADHSDDYTKELVTDFAKTSKSTITYIELPVLHQHEARTKALQYLKNGDWAILLDSDEMIVEWGEDVRNILIDQNLTKAYRVCWTLFKHYGAIPTPRCFKKTETIHYSTDHRRVFDKDGEIDLQHAPIIHIVVDHQPFSDKKKMRKQAELYKNWLLGYETTHWNPEDTPTLVEQHK